MTAALDAVLELLDLEELDTNLYRGTSPEDEGQRVFGGQVAGQALVAASRTVERGLVHSLHAYFLRGGDPRVPIVYQVDRIRDGKSFATRRVTAIQRGRPIFHLSASFHPHERGLAHQIPMPEVPDPESLPTWQERVGDYVDDMPPEMRHWIEAERAIDLRYVAGFHPLEPTRTAPLNQVWMRADGKLPDDPALHSCVVAYASDLTLLDTALLPHGIGWADTDFMMASLDHAMWFHRPFRADEWLLYHQTSPSAAGARGFTRAEIFARDGQLVASVAQEGLIRPIDAKRRGDSAT